MSLLNKNFFIRNLSITVYDFELKDDELVSHFHDDTTSHITIVAKGSILAYGDGWEKVLKQGSLTDFNPFQKHAFKALEDNTRIYNIVKV